MAYTLKMGAFAKLENSTAQPTTTGWAEFSVTLKEGCDLSNPVLSIAESFATLSGYNYATFLGRYYWVQDIRVERTGYCVISLKVDVLATYKTDIGNADLYVLRSSAAADGSIRDNFYPMKATATKYHQDQDATTVPGNYSSGVIVLNVSGIDTSLGTTLIEMIPSEFKRLITALYTDINGFQLTDVFDKLNQLFGGNPQELINGAMWFPYAFDVDSYQQVQIGGWAAELSGTPIQGGVITDPGLTLANYTYTLQKHPLAATRGSYLNLNPYTQYVLGIPGCGIVNLDASKLQNETSITIIREMDAFTGQLIVKVNATSSGQRLAYLSGQIGIPIGLKGSNNANRILDSAAVTIGGTAAAIATGGAAAITGAIASGIGTAIEAIGSTGTSTSMGAGSVGIMLQPGWLDTICYDITDADNLQEGRPYCKIAKPSVLTGFMKVADGYVPISGPLPEQLEVKRILEAGFFYE